MGLKLLLFYVQAYRGKKIEHTKPTKGWNIKFGILWKAHHSYVKGHWLKKSTKKRQFWGTPSGSQSAFACWPSLRSKQNMKKTHSFSDVFCWFHTWNHWKRFKMNKKGWKRLLVARSTQKLVEIHNRLKLNLFCWFG